jgi:hypothetical protein
MAEGGGKEGKVKDGGEDGIVIDRLEGLLLYPSGTKSSTFSCRSPPAFECWFQVTGDR